MNKKESPTDSTKHSKKVCVVGAGASGLTTIKQLLDEGHIPICYERDSDLGGVFNYNKVPEGEGGNGVYDNTLLTISNYLMAFSDMPPSGHRRHWHHTEYKNYLVEYANKFNLNRYIKYSYKIIKIQMIDGGRSGYNVVFCDNTGEKNTERFDAIAVCTGTHQLPAVPKIKGLNSFDGLVIHSSQYQNNKVSKGKNVLCIGMGESSADITREVSMSANNCILGLRSYPFLVPRNLTNSSSDAWTSRLWHSYHTPKSEGIISYIVLFIYLVISQIKSLFFKKEPPKKDAFLQDTSKEMLDLDTAGEVECVKLIKAWNYLSKGMKFYTKNVSFVPYILNGKIKVNASGIKEIVNNTVIFNDGQNYDIDLIMLGTGYRDDFSFIEGFELKNNDVRNMFMHSIHPDLPNCAFIGWARPVTGGIPACSEMAARYYSLLLSGKVSLPSDMHKRMEDDKEFYRIFLAYSPSYNTVIAWKRYMETYAELIGCQLKPIKYIFRPSLFIKLFAGSLVPYQYRIEGPHSLKKEAIDVINRLEVTLPSRHFYENIMINLISKKWLSRLMSHVDYSTDFAEWFRFDVKLTIDDIKKYSFRNDDTAVPLKIKKRILSVRNLRKMYGSVAADSVLD
ncbi:MAG: SidA/IucD/PvdA family monooxygenase [Pseudomonadales bacterium]